MRFYVNESCSETYETTNFIIHCSDMYHIYNLNLAIKIYRDLAKFIIELEL